MTLRGTAPYLLVLLVAAGCGEDEGGESTPDAAPVFDAAPPDAAIQAVELQFAARVNGEPFVCGQTYEGVGSTAAAYTATDFRFYIHDLALLPAGGGDAVSVTLEENDSQSGALALLDFEDRSGACEMGSTSTHTTVTGAIAAGEYVGVSFKVGVPFEMNHLDPVTDPAPLKQTGMSWAWQFGYKFIKADGSVGGQGFNLHLGSTGCPGDSAEQPPSGPCVNPNVVEVELALDPGADTIVADVGRVLRDVDIAVNTPDTAPGCMSFPGDPECNTVFPKLGLPFDEVAAGVQEFLSVE